MGRVVLDYYRRAQHKSLKLPPDAKRMLAQTTGTAARRPPSMEDRVKQLDQEERQRTKGKPFWGSHLGHVEILNAYVHSELGGAPYFVDEKTRELLGFEALVYGHQYFALSIVSFARLSGQNAMADRAQAAFARVHSTETVELARLMR